MQLKTDLYSQQVLSTKRTIQEHRRRIGPFAAGINTDIWQCTVGQQCVPADELWCLNTDLCSNNSFLNFNITRKHDIVKTTVKHCCKYCKT